MAFPDSPVKRKIPDDLETLAMVAWLVRHTGMTKDQVLNRAIEVYHNRCNFFSKRKNTIADLLVTQGHHCYYCNRVVRRVEATLDHKTPQSRGGFDDAENIVVACIECNNEKESMTEAEYLTYREQKYGKPI